MPRPPPTQLTLRLSADQHAPGIARSVIRSAAQVVGAGIAEVAELLVSELVTNSVRHAHMRERDAIEVRMTLARRLRVEVLDAGPGFRLSTAGHPVDDTGGFGLVLLGGLAESWGIEAGPPTCVWFELAIGVSSARTQGNDGQDASRRRSTMGEKTDDMKGRAKEAAGAATGNDDLRREGKMDQAGATVKEKTGNAVDSTKDAIKDVTDRDD